MTGRRLNFFGVQVAIVPLDLMLGDLLKRLPEGVGHEGNDKQSHGDLDEQFGTAGESHAGYCIIRGVEAWTNTGSNDANY